MRKIFAILLLSALVSTLAACDNSKTLSNFSRRVSSSASSDSSTSVPFIPTPLIPSTPDSAPASVAPSVPASVAPSVPAYSQAQSKSAPHEVTPPKDNFINEALLSLPGKSSSEIEKTFGSDYYYIDVGTFTAAIEYYSPYIIFYIDNITHGGKGGDDTPKTDPFEASITVHNIMLNSNYDDSSKLITNQDSLKLFFNTDEEITYELLSKYLDQSPELLYEPTAYYFSVAANQLNKPSFTLPNGRYRANYTFNNANFSVTFLKNNDSYVALSVSIG